MIAAGGHSEKCKCPHLFTESPGLLIHFRCCSWYDFQGLHRSKGATSGLTKSIQMAASRHLEKSLIPHYGVIEEKIMREVYTLDCSEFQIFLV